MRGGLEGSYHFSAWPPIGAPLNNVQREDNWKHFDNSVNAVSFGFVATAILISMFLVMAIFERFLRPTSPSGSPTRGDLESQLSFNPKLGYPSPRMTIYANGVSVLMPGDNIPTFIAHPAPVPCPPTRISLPDNQHIPLPNPLSCSNSSRSSIQEDSTWKTISRLQIQAYYLQQHTSHFLFISINLAFVLFMSCIYISSV